MKLCINIIRNKLDVMFLSPVSSKKDSVTIFSKFHSYCREKKGNRKKIHTYYHTTEVYYFYSINHENYFFRYVLRCVHLPGVLCICHGNIGCGVSSAVTYIFYTFWYAIMARLEKIQEIWTFDSKFCYLSCKSNEYLPNLLENWLFGQILFIELDTSNFGYLLIS